MKISRDVRLLSVVCSALFARQFLRCDYDWQPIRVNRANFFITQSGLTNSVDRWVYPLFSSLSSLKYNYLARANPQLKVRIVLNMIRRSPKSNSNKQLSAIVSPLIKPRLPAEKHESDCPGDE
jgi:hypothetical protein